MRYLIINADDFGNFTAGDRGIDHGMERGVITSTSVMVTRKHTEDIKNLLPFPNISVGLHFELPKDNTSVATEFNRKVELFEKLVGRKPDHIDSHKIRPKDITDLVSYLGEYSKRNRTPIRDWGHANLIDKFFGLNLEGTGTLDLSRITPIGLLKALEGNLKEGYNELMTHAGYVDDEVRVGSSYNAPREIELQSLLSPEFRDYLAANSDIQLISWKEVKI